MKQPEVYISHAWGGESDEIMMKIVKRLESEKIQVVYDHKDLKYRGNISEFMNELGKAKAVVIILSNKYLHSEYCMFELLNIYENSQFRHRIFPVVLDEVEIAKSKDRIELVKFWEGQHKELEAKMRELESLSNIEGITEDLNLYNDIRRSISKLTYILRDINTLSIKLHTEEKFQSLTEQIQAALTSELESDLTPLEWRERAVKMMPWHLLGELALLRKKKQGLANDDRWLQRILISNVFIYLIGYGVLVWILFRSLIWIEKSLMLFTNITDILLIFFLIMIPSVMIKGIYNQNANSRKFSRGSRFFIPINLIIAILLSIGSTNKIRLETTTEKLSLKDESGRISNRAVIKMEYLIKLPIYYFEPETSDTLNNWLGAGIAIALEYKLKQNDYILAGEYNAKQSVMAKLKYARDRGFKNFLTGTYIVKDGMFTIKTKIHEVPSGEVTHEYIHSASNFFEVIDRISDAYRNDLILGNAKYVRFGQNVPIQDLTTHDLRAFKNFIVADEGQGTKHSLHYYDLALNIDSTFALAAFKKAAQIYREQLSKEEAERTIELAMRHRYRLDEEVEMGLRSLAYNIAGRPDLALDLLQLQSKLYPKNTVIAMQLVNQYDRLGLTKDMIEVLENEAQEITDIPDVISKLAYAYQRNGQMEKAIEVQQAVCDKFSSLYFQKVKLGSMYLQNGNFSQARDWYQAAILMSPENNANLSRMLTAIDYLQTKNHNANWSRRFAGNYRNDLNGERVWKISPIRNGLFYQDITGSAANFWFPIADNQFISRSGKTKAEFVSDNHGNITKRVVEDQSQHRPYDSWKQDSLIIKAIEQLTWEEYENALISLQSAYTAHPEHYYLDNFIKHTKFVLGPEYETAKAKFGQFAGRYNDREIIIRDSHLYFKKDRVYNRLLPLSDTLFQVFEQYSIQVVFQVKEDSRDLKVVYRNPKDEEFYN